MESKNQKNEGLVTKSKALRIKALIRAFFFSFLCGVLLVGNFVWEQSVDTKKVSYAKEISVENDRINIMNYAYIAGKVAPVSDYLALVQDTDDQYVFALDEGRIWGSFGSLVTKVNIRVGEKVVIIPSFSDFDVNYDDGTIYMNNYKGNTYVGFLADGVDQFEYLDEYSDVFENVLMVPAGIKVRIPLSKVDARLRPLLFSKLSKEFAYSFIPASDFEDSFVETNLSGALKFSDELKEGRRDEFEEQTSSQSSVSSSVSGWLTENLSVFESKRDEYYIDRLNTYIYEALVADYDEERQEAFDGFKLAKDTLPTYFLSKWISDLVVFEAQDDEMDVLNFLIDEAEGEFDELYLLALKVGAYNENFYSGNDVGLAYTAVYGDVEDLFGFTDNDALYKKFLAYYNQMFDNLLLYFPDLYKLQYFEMKDAIEAELFDLYYGGQLREELKQSFVSKKISFLKRLKYFFFGEEIEIDDAKGVMKYLIESIDHYMPAKTSQNAVIQLFEQELEGVGNFWGYLNNVEYSKSHLYGQTHEERYDFYLEEKDQVTSILDVQRDILGGDVVVSFDADDVADEIGSIFESVGAQEVKVENFDDVHQRYVKVYVKLSGYSVEVEYDREYGYVRNIYAYGKLLTENSVKIDSLEEFVIGELADVVDEIEIENSGEAGDPETNAQKIAKAIIAKEVVEAGFSAGIDDVEIMDSIVAKYRLNDVDVVGETGLKISFDYLANDGTVTNIFVVKDEEGTVVTGEFPLEDLKDIVASEHY